MLVGRRKRAPDWVQRVGAEWLFRAAQEPGRLGRRYTRDALVFLPQLGRYLRLLQKIRSGQDVQLEVTSDGRLHIRSGAPRESSLDVDEAAGFIERDETIDAISFAFDAGVPHPSALAEMLGFLRAAQRLGLRRSVAPLGAESVQILDHLGLASWIMSLDREDP
jgi:N-acetylglucosaminyldiphosphoundecaprenol N-acetyl-beta-D-mannosaminyltransferase